MGNQLIFLFGEAGGDTRTVEYINICRDVIKHLGGSYMIIDSVKRPKELLEEVLNALSKINDENRDEPFIIFCGENLYFIQDKIFCGKLNGYSYINALLAISGGYKTEKQKDVVQSIFLRGVDYSILKHPELQKHNISHHLNEVLSKEVANVEQARMFKDIYVGGVSKLMEN